MTTEHYEQKAIDFLNKNNIKIDITFKKNDFYSSGDKDKRDIYEITIKKNNRLMTFNFGQSLNKSGFKVIYIYKNFEDTKKKFSHIFNDANLYKSKNLEDDILDKFFYNRSFFGNAQVIEITPPTPPTSYDVLSCLTYNDPGTFEDFCLEFGYNNDSIKDLELYQKVVKEYQQVLTIFNDNEIKEIQDFL